MNEAGRMTRILICEFVALLAAVALVAAFNTLRIGATFGSAFGAGFVLVGWYVGNVWDERVENRRLNGRLRQRRHYVPRFVTPRSARHEFVEVTVPGDKNHHWVCTSCGHQETRQAIGGS